MYELLGLVLEGEEVLGGAAPAVAAKGGAGEHLWGAHLLSTLNTIGTKYFQCSIKDQMTCPFNKKTITFRCTPEFLKSIIVRIPHSNKTFNSWRPLWTHHITIYMNPIQPHLTLAYTYTNCSKIFLQDLAHFDFHTSYFFAPMWARRMVSTSFEILEQGLIKFSLKKSETVLLGHFISTQSTLISIILIY